MAPLPFFLCSIAELYFNIETCLNGKRSSSLSLSLSLSLSPFERLAECGWKPLLLVCCVLFVYVCCLRAVCMFYVFSLLLLSIVIFGNTVGNLIEFYWVRQNYHGPQCTGTCVKNRRVRFHRTRDFKRYHLNSIPPTSLCPGVPGAWYQHQPPDTWYGHCSCQDPTNQDPLNIYYENAALRNYTVR